MSQGYRGTALAAIALACELEKDQRALVEIKPLDPRADYGLSWTAKPLLANSEGVQGAATWDPQASDFSFLTQPADGSARLTIIRLAAFTKDEGSNNTTTPNPAGWGFGSLKITRVTA